MFKKLITKISLVAIIFILLLSTVTATDFSIKDVYINGIHTSSLTEINPGDSIKITTWIQGNNEAEIKMRAWITGYEYDFIEETTEQFHINENVLYKKELTLDIPEDLDLDSTYTLHIELFNKDQSVKESYELFIINKNHNLVVKDNVMTDNIEAGSLLYTKLRIQNNGQKDEEDISVDMIIEDLNINNRVYIDNLDVDEKENINMYLSIPDNVVSGYYTVEFILKYDNGYVQTVYTDNVYINGVSDEFEAIVQFPKIETSNDQEVSITIMNLGEKRNYNLVIVSDNTEAHTPEVTINKNDIDELTFTLKMNNEKNIPLTISVYTEGKLIDSQSYNIKAQNKTWKYISLGLSIFALAIFLNWAIRKVKK